MDADCLDSAVPWCRSSSNCAYFLKGTEETKIKITSDRREQKCLDHVVVLIVNSRHCALLSCLKRGSKPGGVLDPGQDARDARDTRVLNDMGSSTVSTNCLKGCSFLPWNFYETVYQVPMLSVLKTKPMLLLS